MRDYSDDLKDLRRRLGEASGYLKITDGRARLVELEHEVARPDLWDDQELAKRVNGEYANVKGDLDTFDRLAGDLEDVEVLHEMAREVDDASQEPDIEAAIASITNRLDQLDMRSLFTGEHDEADCIVQINAKDGGVDAQDWAEILLRMYGRWAERRGLQFEVDGISEGAEAGIMSAEFTLSGRYAYGLMTSERGTHRLVRISPFDNQGRRQTSFAAVQVWPVLEDPDVEINEADIRMEVFRASGAGGQHVNKTESAVRIRHLPSGIVVACQNERSQHKNRSTAMKMLKAKLYELEVNKRNAAAKVLEDAKSDVSWGNQIRSYVLDQSRIKDLRTGVEIGNTTAVLDGDLDAFLEASLKQGL
jgi:peptide chain release factor 2